MKYFLIVLLIATSLTSEAFAQDMNPFQSIGKKGKITTASHGKFIEVFDYDSVQRIGSVLINIRSKKVVKLLNINTTSKLYSDNSAQSRWYSVDPMTEGQEQWSPYHFAYNNPIRFNDPDGRMPGDFYDQNANKIGTDGKKDGKNYIVTNPTDVKTIQSHTNASSQGGTTQVSQLSSTPVEMPSSDARQKMGAAVNRSNNPSTEAGDKTGGMHEEGGVTGKDQNGNPVTVDAKPGQVFTPGTNGVGVNPLNPDVHTGGADGRTVLENGYTAATMTTDETYHVHPKGNGTVSFVQPPSNADLNNAVYRSQNLGIQGNSYVLGAGNYTVYIYRDVNGQGKVIATFPLQQFISIK
jgi:hypothetical protein